jgi:hypothetical protein
MSDKDENAKGQYVVVGTPKPKSYSTEWFLSNYFEQWTPKTLETAVKTNYMIDIAEWGSQIVNYITDQFIAWAKTYREDLYKILITPGGKRWVKNLILNMMKQI